MFLGIDSACPELFLSPIYTLLFLTFLLAMKWPAKLIKQEYMVDFYKDFKAIFLLNNWKFWGYQNSSLSLTPV